MKEEIKIFFTALMFYTRIPCPAWVDHSPDYINKATRYFPLIGWIVGAISFTVFWFGSMVFGQNIAVLLSIVAGIFVTGAFHEDGFADVFDGFGGGWSKEKILEIMKDSRVGAYGAIAISALLFLKYIAIGEILLKLGNNNFIEILLIFIAYHALARLTAINIVFTEQYAREDETSKAKPIAKAHSMVEIVGAYFFGLLPLFILCYFHIQYIFVFLPLVMLYFYAKNYFNKWLQGYTGDCLGAVEQFAEIFVLLTFVSVWKFL
jgi:adenosylcobinamide-GDP ribazoletransferase